MQRIKYAENKMKIICVNLRKSAFFNPIIYKPKFKSK